MANYKQLSYGATGEEVKQLQEKLNKAGNYNLDTDGIYGDKTKAAVTDYQQKNSLKVDGIAGDETFGSLNKTQAGTSAPATPSDNVLQAEALLQQQLQKPGAYTSSWQAQLDDILQKIQNREKFSYDLNGDALYQQYKDQYMTQGKLAMMDTMGQAAALTGGYGSSYAQMAGQQAYQGYLQGLNDKVPELYQLALNQYNADGDELYRQASLIAGMEEQDYGRYRDQVSDAQWDKSFQYQKEQDRIKQENWQAEFDEAKRQYDQQYALSVSKLYAGDGNGNVLPTELEPVYDLSQRTSDAYLRRFMAKLHPEGQHDAVMRATYGPYTAYVAYMLGKDTSLSDAEKASNEHYSRWDTQEAYNEAVQAQKDREAMIGFDMDAGQKEIEDLEEFYDQAYTINLWYDEYQRGSIPYDAQKLEVYNRLMDEYGGSFVALEEDLQQKKQYMVLAGRAQEGHRLAAVADSTSELYDPNFQAYVDIGNTIDYKAFGEGRRNHITGRGRATTYHMDKYRAAAIALAEHNGQENLPGLGNEKLNIFRKMNEDEFNTLAYYLAKDQEQGTDLAKQYVDSIEEALNIRRGTDVGNAIGGIPVVRDLFGIYAGLDQFATGVGNLFSDEDYFITNSTQAASAAVREKIGEDDILGWKPFGSSLGQMSYDLITTTANMAPSILASYAVGMLNPVAGSVVGNTLMGASAAGNAYADAINRGFDKNQAETYGVAIGVSEALLSQALSGIGKLGGTSAKIAQATAGIDKALLRFAANYGGKFASEALEEGLQEILDPIIQNAVLGTDENVDWEQVCYSALLGGLSAGVLEGPGTIRQTVVEQNLKKEYGGNTDALILEGLGNDVSSESYQFATEYKAKTDAGKALTGAEIRNLLAANQEQIKTKDLQNIQQAAEKRLVELGQTEDVATIAELAVKYATGQSLTRAERSQLANSKYGATLARSLASGNQVSRVDVGQYDDALMNLAQEVADKASRKEQAQQTEEFTHFENNLTTEAKNLPESHYEVSEDGKMVNTEESSTANYRQVTEESTATEKPKVKSVTLEGASKKYGPQAQAMIHAYQTGQDVAMYDQAYQVAYDMGKSGVPFDYVKGSQSANYLTDSQKELAYEAGRAASDTAAKELDAKNKAAANGKTVRKKGTVKGEGVTIADLKQTFNDPQGKAYKYLSTVAEVTGIDIVLYRSEAGLDGKFQGAQGRYSRSEPGTIYIDLNAGLSDIKSADDLAKYAMLRTFAHEFTHFVENLNPIQYNELRKVVFDTLTERGENVHDLIGDKQASNPGMSYDKASREVVAEAMTDILPDLLMWTGILWMGSLPSIWRSKA